MNTRLNPLYSLILLLLGLCISTTTSNAANRTVDSHLDNGQPGTLRYEIGQSQDGDVITITTTSTIVITGTEIEIATDLTIRAQTNAHAVIDGNANSRIFVITLASVTLSGLTLQNGYEGGGPGGGAMRLHYGRLTAEYCTIANSTTNRDNGGGILALQSSIVLSNCDFNSNKAWSYGGGLYTLATDLFATSCTFRYNGTTDDQEGGALFGEGGSFEFHDCQFFGNGSHGFGGGAFIEDAPATVASCTFWDNDGYGDGLCMYFKARTTHVIVAMTDCIVTSLNIQGDGAAFGFVARNIGLMTADITRCEVYGSTNANDGAAISFEDNSVAGNSLSIYSSTFANNSADQDAGAILVYGRGTVTHIQDCEFRNNRSHSSGGALLIRNSAYESEATIINCSFVGNHSEGGLNSGFGGAATFTGALLNVQMLGCRMENNWSDAGGGALQISACASALIQGCSIEGSTSNQIGGAILIRETGYNVTIASCTIASCRSLFSNGGAFYCDSDTPVTITSSTVTNNSAAGSGGALFLNSGTINIISTEFLQSTASSQGGAFYLNSGIINVRDSDIRGGHAAAGGAVYFNTAIQATFTDCEIVTNGCLDRGGAFSFSSDAAHNVTCNNVLFEDNACSAEGAGIYLQNGTMLVTSCTFVNNRAASGISGGGIFQYNGTLDVYNTTFANNRSNFEGGGIKKFNGTLTVKNCEFAGNIARGGSGGGLMHTGGPTLITNSSFINNTSAQNGGGIAATASLLDVFNCTFSGNEADSLGGGMYSSAGGLDVASCTFTGNTADADNNGGGDGGGLWAATDVFTSNLIAGNTDRGGECPDVGAISSSQGYNLIGTVGQYNFTANTTGDRYGDPNGVVSPNAGALESGSVINAQLEALADNGGFGRTHAIGPNSPAFGGSTTAGVSLLDQRGVARFGTPDIGAFELYVPLNVTGPSTVCLGSSFDVHVVTPLPGSSYSWSVFNGEVVSGGSSTCAVVKVNSLAGGSITLTETLSFGEVRTTTFTVASVMFAAMDHASVIFNNTVEIDVLANDTGANLTLLSVDTPSLGSAVTTSSGKVRFTPPFFFTGCIQFNYTVTNKADCRATGAIIVAVQTGIVENPQLEFIEQEKDRVNGVRGLNNVSDVIVSPDGNHAYAAGWLDNSIAMFNRDTTSGELEYIGRMRHGRNGVTRMRYPAALAFSPGGEQLYVVANRDNSIVVFDRNATTGKLSFVEYHRHNQDGVQGLQRPRAVAVSPLGDNVYVASYNSDAIAVFARDAATGRLQYLERHKNNVDGVRGLNGAMDVTVSLDGTCVYAAGYADDAVAHFERDLTNGRLTFRDWYRDGFDGINGLAGAASVVVTSDAKYAYVAGKVDNAIAMFSRSTSTGTLSYMGRIHDGAPGIKGLARVSDLAVSKDGAYLYSVAETDHDLMQFKRDINTGELTKADRKSDGDGGVDGLKQAAAVAVSNDGKHVYAAGKGDDAISVFDWIILPGGESRTISRFSTQSTVSTLFIFTYETHVPETISGYTQGTYGSVTLASNTTVGPNLRLSSFEYTAVINDFPDSFTYTLENPNGSTTYTVTIIEEMAKSAPWLTGRNAPESLNTTPDDIPVNISPNPARDLTDIAFVLNGKADAEISIFDMSGAIVARIALPQLTAGEHHTLWRIGAGGGLLPQGSYVVRINARDADGRMLTGSSMLKLIR